MGRKTLTPEDRLALAQSRGYSAQNSLDRQNQLSQTEQPLLAGATKDLHEHVGEIWHEFLAVKGLKMDASLQLEPVILKDFVEYYASSRYGRIGELPTVYSIATVWYRFVGYQNRITSSKLDRQLVNDVAAFIGVSLRQKLDLSTKKRDKYLVTFKDLTRLMTHLWCFHDHEYLHERYRVQLSFMLILFASCGARAGAIVESSSYRGTNQALAYKDCHIHLLRLPGGEFTFELEIIQRYTKGKRNDENENLHVILKSEHRLMYNGIMFFFSLAIADNAIKGYDTLDALMKARLPEGRDSWELEWKEEARELPVLRMASAKGVDKIRALTYAALWNQVVPLGYEIGYRDSVKIHAIRAGVANKIKDPEVRRKFLDQANTGIYNKSYESKIAKAYGFSMYKGDDAPTDNIETLQSMDHRRDGNAPKDLPAKEKAEFFQRPDVQHLNMLIAQATRDIDGKPAEHPARFKERQKLYGEKRSLLRLASKSYREEWFSTSYDQEALRQVQSLEDEDKLIPAKSRKIGIFQLTRRFMPARDRIANAILAETDQSQAALQDIYSLCVDDNRVAYRPNEHPVDGMCPREGCFTAMIELPIAMRSKHIHACRQRELRDTLSQQPDSYSRRLRNRKLPFAEYCYACCEWSCREDDWDNHCKFHLEKLELRCGLLSFRYTLVVAGYCPFCLGNEDLSPSQRMQQWMTKSTLLNHIDTHLTTYAGSECPHPICHAHLEAPSDFRAHFEDVHCIEEPRSNCVSRKRKSDDNEQKVQDTKGEALNHVSKKAKNEGENHMS